MSLSSEASNRARRWTFTVHLSYLDNDFRWKPPEPANERLRFLVAQREVTPTTRQYHYQGYAEFTVPVRRSAAQRALGIGRSHCSPARGTRDENVEYCSKEETRSDPPDTIRYVARGVYTDVDGVPVDQRGRRTDLQALSDDIRASYDAGGRAAAETCCWETHAGAAFKYQQGINAFISHFEHKDNRNVTKDVTIRVGPTGTGKTWSVYNTYPDLWRAPAAARGQKFWFQGYTGQRVVLFDDYDGNSIPIATLLQLLDRYPVPVEVKGSSVVWRAEVIVFTTNIPYARWYEGADVEHRKALQRRIHRIIQHDEEGQNGGVELEESNWRIPF